MAASHDDGVVEPDAVVRGERDADRAMARRELRAFAGPDTAMATGRPSGRAWAAPRSVDPRRIPRSPGDVRALPHAGQSHRHLSRRRLLSRWRQAGGGVP